MIRRIIDLHFLYKLALLTVILIVLCAAFAPWIAPFDPYQVAADEILQHGSAKHWLGTDALGRDLLSKMLVGVTLGIAGGYFGGMTDRIIQCMVSMIQGLPGMSMMIAIAAVLPENDFRLIIAVTLTSWAGFSRIVRSEVIRLKGETYIEGIKSLGAGNWYILKNYIFPNIFSVIAVLLTLRIGTSLLSASALSYLGLGVSPPAADWGVMISDARTYFRSYPVMIIAPGLGITLFSLGINLTGDALCELLSLKKQSGNHREI